MPRRGRSASPPPAQRRAAPAPARAAPTQNLPARAPQSAPMQASAPPSAMGAPQQPSMFQQMAATAGGVAIGSAVGHTVGAGLTSMFSGGGDKEVAQAPAQAAAAQPQYTGSHPQDPQGPCAWEMKEFLQCAQGQSDLTLCDGFNEALRQCRTRHHLA